jgi:hydroxymethylbilane synthase
MAPARRVRLATRGSPLARWQADRVASLLAPVAGVVGIDTIVVETSGDRRLDVPVSALGGQGAFVKEVQSAVLDGRADIAVHSAKDLPSSTPPGLVLACVPERADPRDALVGCALDAIAPGAAVASGSVRRRAQLAWMRPDLTFVELRGNMATRLARAKAVGAGVLAMAALERLGLAAEVAEVLDADTMVPQVAQGALAIECRADDAWMLAALDAIDDVAAHRAVDGERSFLATLGGGCTLPLGALGRSTADGGLVLSGMLASRDGHVLLRDSVSGDDPVAVGRALAERLLDAGGRSLDDFAGVP